MSLYHKLIFIKMKKTLEIFYPALTSKGSPELQGWWWWWWMYSFLPSYKMKIPLNIYIVVIGKNKNLISKERYKISFPSPELIVPQGKTVEWCLENLRNLVEQVPGPPSIGAFQRNLPCLCHVGVESGGWRSDCRGRGEGYENM